MIDSALLAVTPIYTFAGDQPLTSASGFFFARDDRLFVVTNRHVVHDAPSQHAPDRIEIELHTNADNLAETVRYSIPLFSDDAPAWRQGIDQAGEIDVAMLLVDREAFPDASLHHAFTPAHLVEDADTVPIGAPALIVGLPLGFHDHLHGTPVARLAIVASSFGLRFQGFGYFLTDARTHRGLSGSPVVMRDPDDDSDLPWKLLGIHSARLDVGRDINLDETLGLNIAWYADILLTLSEN